MEACVSGHASRITTPLAVEGAHIEQAPDTDAVIVVPGLVGRGSSVRIKERFKGSGFVQWFLSHNGHM